MMTQLRERTALILWFVIFAFVGLIVVEWGADFSSTGGGGSDGSTVGVVNGEEISYETFRKALSNAVRQQAQEERDQDRGRLVREIWDSFVQEIVLRQEMERLDIQVTDRELAHYMRTQPPPAVQNIEVFQTDGEFDLVKYNQFLSDPAVLQDAANKGFVLQVENMLRQQLMNYKLQRLLAEMVQVSPADVRDYYAEQSEKVEVEYLFTPSSGVTDEQVEITDADLAAYYQEHQEDFRHPEQIRIEFAYFPKTASAADSVAVAEEIGRLHQEIDAGADFAGLAEAVSDDPGSAEKGGDLGTFGRGRMVKPFEEVAFALEEGEVSEPVQTRFGWHLIKVEKKLAEGDEEQIQARHILLRFKPSRQTDEELQEQVEAFKTRAETEGFQAAVDAEELQARDSGYLRRGSQVPGLGPGTTWLVNMFFEQETGSVSGVGGNENGLWVAHLSEKRLEGIAPLEEVRTRIEREVSNRKKAEKAGEQLETVRQQVLGSADLAQAAEEAGLELMKPEPFARSESVPGVGRGNAFVTAAFRLGAGELSEVIALPPRGAYLIKALDKAPVDEEQFETERDQLTQQLLQQRQQEAMQNWFAHVFEVAEIKDYRHQFGLTF